MSSTLKIITDSFCLSVVSFSKHLKGAYLELLIAQNLNGPLSLEDIKTILGVDFDIYWESKLKGKFEIDKQGNFFNCTDIRIKEIEKPTSKEEMIERVARIDEKKKQFQQTIEPYVSIYGADHCNAFYKCWGEANKSKTKLRWEMQETWELSKRIKKFKLFKPFKKRNNVYIPSVKPEPLTPQDIEFYENYKKLKEGPNLPIEVKTLGEKMADKIGDNQLSIEDADDFDNLENPE